MLEDLDITYTQPLFGKLVIEPPPAVQGGKSVTFWPAKKRLRIGRRATQRQQDIPAFEQALADQGHQFRVTCPDVQGCPSHRDCRRRNA